MKNIATQCAYYFKPFILKNTGNHIYAKTKRP